MSNPCLPYGIQCISFSSKLTFANLALVLLGCSPPVIPSLWQQYATKRKVVLVSSSKIQQPAIPAKSCLVKSLFVFGSRKHKGYQQKLHLYLSRDFALGGASGSATTICRAWETNGFPTTMLLSFWKTVMGTMDLFVFNKRGPWWYTWTSFTKMHVFFEGWNMAQGKVGIVYVDGVHESMKIAPHLFRYNYNLFGWYVGVEFTITIVKTQEYKYSCFPSFILWTCLCVWFNRRSDKFAYMQPLFF